MMVVHVYDTIYVTQFEFITLFTLFTATIWDWYNYVHIQMRKLKSEEVLCLKPVSWVVRYRSKIWISHLSPNQLIQNYFPCSKIRHCVSVSMITLCKCTRQLSLFIHDKLRKMLSSLIHIFLPSRMSRFHLGKKSCFFFFFNLITSCPIVGMIIVRKSNSDINILSIYDIRTLNKTLLVFTRLRS